MISRRGYWIGTGLVLVLYLVLAWVGLVEIGRFSGGIMPPDSRAQGYDITYFNAFSGALAPQGRALYLGPLRVIDSAFIAAFTAWMWLTLHRNTRGIWRAALVLPLAYAGFDLIENASVSALLRAPIDITAQTVAFASLFTVLKFCAIAASMISILVTRPR